jgi:hypothetical protein
MEQSKTAKRRQQRIEDVETGDDHRGDNQWINNG